MVAAQLQHEYKKKLGSSSNISSASGSSGSNSNSNTSSIHQQYNRSSSVCSSSSSSSSSRRRSSSQRTPASTLHLPCIYPASSHASNNYIPQTIAEAQQRHNRGTAGAQKQVA
eukprot:CAMPEP_0173323400 /NCGR_PEP_ID=MMETSP1143-20121109/30502_1 /TAXON_ID=483371 /ORGANISM="non described non described, Strain CCMP2298" /LENGTH=112 /DNA_ID=CAMNT_0014267373 /DNA_START=735 /DNA_END=1070 /DNA_ORIENTATION=+